MRTRFAVTVRIRNQSYLAYETSDYDEARNVAKLYSWPMMAYVVGNWGFVRQLERLTAKHLAKDLA